MKLGYRIHLAFFVSLLLFSMRPVFFDEPAFIEAAKASAEHPLKPYHYELDIDYPDQSVWEKGKHPIATNPPLSSWLLALPVKLFGENIFGMRLMTILFMVLAGIFVGKISQLLFKKDCLWPLLFWMVSPCVFLTSVTLYPHAFYFCFYAITIYATLKLCDTSKLIWGGAVGIGLALAALSLHQWPVLVAVVFTVAHFRHKKKKEALMGLALGGLVFLLVYGTWCLWEIQTYGQTQFMATYDFRALQGGSYQWAAAFLPLSFLVGGIPLLFLVWYGLLKEKSNRWMIAVAMIPVGVLVFGPLGYGFSIWVGLFSAVLVSTGIIFILKTFSLGYSKANQDLLLLSWFLIEFLFLQVFLTKPSGHHLLPISLSGCLVLYRLFQRSKIRLLVIKRGVVAVGVLTFLLMVADTSQSRIGPKLAKDEPPPIEGSSYYWGSSFGGYEYYLKKSGWKPIDTRTGLPEGSVLLVARHMNSKGPLRAPKEWGLEFQRDRRYHQWNPLRTLSGPVMAGWYSASWGLLPYSLSFGPSEQIYFGYAGTRLSPDARTEDPEAAASR